MIHGQAEVAANPNSNLKYDGTTNTTKWAERRYVNGALAGTERWTAILTVVLQPPKTEEKLRKNPLGIYVDGINWSRQLSGGTTP